MLILFLLGRFWNGGGKPNCQCGKRRQWPPTARCHHLPNCDQTGECPIEHSQPVVCGRWRPDSILTWYLAVHTWTFCAQNVLRLLSYLKWFFSRRKTLFLFYTAFSTLPTGTAKVAFLLFVSDSQISRMSDTSSYEATQVRINHSNWILCLLLIL